MTITNKLISILLIALFISSCKDKVDFEEFSTEIRATFTTKDTVAKSLARNIPANVYAIYKSNNFQPIWIDKNGTTEKAAKFLEELKTLPEEGITTGRYKLDDLNKHLEIIKKDKGGMDIKSAVEFDKKITIAYVQAANDLAYGILDPEEITDMWYHDNDSSIQISDNIKDNKFPSLDIYRSKLSTYNALVTYRKTISTDSLKAVTDANLERLRWLPQTFEDNYVIVVVPRMDMVLMEKGKAVKQMKAVVGQPERETPSLNADMVHVVFNPSWGVPPGIMKKDVIPGLLSKGQAYLNKKGLKVYDRQGNEVNPNDVTEENYKRYVFRQEPSEKNALGQVKFDMPNPWAIYLHDTPTKGDFEKEERAKSSGCVRLNYPLDLANYILTEMNDKDYDRKEIDSIVSNNETKYVKLKHRLPVHIVYLTAFDAGGDQPVFYKDIYNKDIQLAELLK